MKEELEVEPSGNLTFSQALNRLKEGRRIAREGWNGKGMYLIFVEGDNCKITNIAPHSNPDKILLYETLSWIGMKTVDNKFVPWLASQTDVLANDWTVIE